MAYRANISSPIEKGDTPVTVTDLVDAVRASRRHFWKHVDGLSDAQWDWKPYPECKSVTETLAHLVQDDRAALAALESGGEPDYEAFAEPERDRSACARCCPNRTSPVRGAPIALRRCSAGHAPVGLGHHQAAGDRHPLLLLRRLLPCGPDHVHPNGD